MPDVEFYPLRQFQWIRLALGLTCFYLFISILPYSRELFSEQAWLPASFSLSGLPGIFSVLKTPLQTEIVIVFLSCASVLLAIGIAWRWMAIAVWFGIVSMLSRDFMFYDFDLEYLGWLLLAIALIPSPPRTDANEGEAWRMPKILYWGAWLVLGASYTGSGIGKLLNVEWQQGRVLQHIFSTPLIARFPLSKSLLWENQTAGGVLHVATWWVLAAEVLFLPLALFRRTRPWAWLNMTVIQLGIGLTTVLTPLSWVVLLFHAFVFDVRWIKQRFQSTAR